MWKSQGPAVPNCVINLSKIQLSLSERNALMFGSNRHILPKKIDEIAVKSQIESQLNRICTRNKVKLSYDNKSRLRQAADCFIHESKGVCNTRKNEAMHRTLMSSANNTKTKCCRMDKGVGLVILDKEDYFFKLDSIFQDTKRFLEVGYDLQKSISVRQCEQAPWIIKENSVASYIRKYIWTIVDDVT